MRVQFIGVGEAFDEEHANTSIAVSFGAADRSVHLLLDCGFTAAAAYYRHASIGADLDAVWISHFHGDHFLGLPLLLLRFQDEGRTRPLMVVGQQGGEDKLWDALELAYPTFRQRLAYPVLFHEVDAGQNFHLMGASWSFAANDHSDSAPCLSLRLAHGGRTLFYSGDGRPTPASLELMRGVDLLIHEAFGMEAGTPGHGGVRGCLDLARTSGARALALVHVNRRVRRAHGEEIRAMLAREFGAQGMLPEAGFSLYLE